MTVRKYFIAALILVLGAIFVHFKAFGYAAEAVEQIHLAQKVPAEAASTVAKREALQRQANIAVCIGIACGVLSALLAFVSYQKEESAPQMVVVVVLLFYVVLHFGVV